MTNAENTKRLAAGRAGPRAVGVLAYLALALSVGLSACGSGSDDDRGLTFKDFRDTTQNAAGAEAVDCGHVDLGGDRSPASCCVVSNYAQSLPAFATYDKQGIDSRIAEGFAARRDGTVVVVSYDSGLETGNGSDATLDERNCDAPVASPNACSDPNGQPFVCATP